MNKNVGIQLCLGLSLAWAGLGWTEVSAQTPPWWKGNLHTHSLWSDGDDYPEMIVDWYKSRGYHFLALSDHNILSQGERWIDSEKNRGGLEAFEQYFERFGGAWVETREKEGRRQVRLKPLNEYRALFEETGRFRLLQSEEISDRFGKKPIHLNAANLKELIPPQGGGSVAEVIQNNLDAVWEQSRRTGRLMLPHVNHPNFGWAVTAEDLIQLSGDPFFEVYNGHPYVRNEGDRLHASTERMWDIVLTWRLAVTGDGPVYGIAVDDAHNYHQWDAKRSNAGRGWVMVQSEFLTPEFLLKAMLDGEFYASTGVTVESIETGEQGIRLKMKSIPGVDYVTRFIGTKKGFDRERRPVKNEEGNVLPVTQRYSDDIGQILKEVSGDQASYEFQGDEVFVRAKVISSRLQDNPYRQGTPESAWIQPAVPK